MIAKLSLSNFRSIRDSELPLGKITVLTGLNNSGKSSIIYGLLALKNVVLNPNQSLDSLLNLGFINLGGFEQAVYFKKENSTIALGIHVLEEQIASQYTASLSKNDSVLSLNVSMPYPLSVSLDVTFPYSGYKTADAHVSGPFGSVGVTWDGISSRVEVQPLARGEFRIGEIVLDKNQQEALRGLSRSLNVAVEELRAVDFIPLRRGFTKPSYSSVPMQPQLINEDELATLLAANRDLEAKVAHYLEQMIGRTFSVRPLIGTANFNLQSRDRSTGFVCDLVNEGFGTNQLVTIMAKALREEMHTICIEESEIHLHPELMDKLVDVFVNISQEEGKSFIISTHSEHIVLSLLNEVAKNRIKPEDVCIYYLSKDGKETKIERQEVNEKGQVKGGLRGFYEAELKQVKEFFSIS
jgi:predicted ATPase